MSTKTQARKRLRQDAKKRIHNLSAKSRIKTEIKKFRTAISEGQADVERLKIAQSLLDKAGSKGIIHRRQAARRKSRLAKALNQTTRTS